MKNSIMLNMFFIGNLLGSQSQENYPLMLLATTAATAARLPISQPFVPSSNPSSPTHGGAPTSLTTDNLSQPIPQCSTFHCGSPELGNGTNGDDYFVAESPQPQPADQLPEVTHTLSAAQQKRQETIRENKRKAAIDASSLIVSEKRRRRVCDHGPMVSTEAALQKWFSNPRKTSHPQREQIIPATSHGEKDKIDGIEFSSFTTLKALKSNSSSESVTSTKPHSQKVSSKSITHISANDGFANYIQGSRAPDGSYKFECPHCQKLPPSSARCLANHMKQYHPKEHQLIECPLCKPDLNRLGLVSFYDHLKGKHLLP